MLALSDAFSESHPGVSIVWHPRSLAEFEDTSLEALAEQFDILAIDHPHMGDAVASGALAPLDGLATGGRAGAAGDDSFAGLSMPSYRWDGHQWALPVDAATMVSAYRPADLSVEDLPRSWSDFREFSALVGRERVLFPANPTHMLLTLLSLCDVVRPMSERQADGSPAWWGPDGIRTDVLHDGVELLRTALDLSAPRSIGRDPIGVLGELSAGGRALYCPLVFQYVTYARDPRPEHAVRFRDALEGTFGAAGTVLGGVGLAVSGATLHHDLAVEFVRFATEALPQVQIVAAAGGQPARREAWTDPEVNREANGFYEATTCTIRRSFLRPRVAGYPAFQSAAGQALHALIIRGAATHEIGSELSRLWAGTCGRA